MGFFGRISSFAGGVARRFGEVGKAAIHKIGEIKDIYDGINNSTGGIIGHAIESIPRGVGDVLKGVGNFLKNKESIGALENTFDHLRVYGTDFQKLGNKLLKEGR